MEKVDVNANAGKAGDEKDRKLHITINTPAGKWQHPFNSDATIREVIAQTVEHFKGSLEPANYELRKKGATTALSPDATLESSGVEDRSDLALVPETGGGK
jgi:hypothetical protein